GDTWFIYSITGGTVSVSKCYASFSGGSSATLIGMFGYVTSTTPFNVSECYFVCNPTGTTSLGRFFSSPRIQSVFTFRDCYINSTKAGSTVFLDGVSEPFQTGATAMTLTRCGIVGAGVNTFVNGTGTVPLTLIDCFAPSGTTFASGAAGVSGTISNTASITTAALIGTGATTYWTTTAGFPKLTNLASFMSGYTTGTSTGLTAPTIIAGEDDTPPVITIPEAVVCFAAGTRLLTADGKSIAIENVRPGMKLATSHSCAKHITVQSIITCLSWKVVEFPPFTLHHLQDKTLFVSPYHLVYHSLHNKWAEANMMEGGFRVLLHRPVQLFNIQACEGWKTMVANNVLSETCAMTESEKLKRKQTIERFNIPHAI
ncbi:hypothetical protein, partial [Asticcacaulis sp.]|uniref:hypothetical protein n=1 Tax=Asticcacaulis sp. TaxID=1872648 RepID=UPI00260BF19A